MLRKLAILSTLTLAALPLGAKRTPTILDVRHEITDTAMVFPESVQTDVHRMQQNWYLRNYTILDTVGTAPVKFSDDEIIQRLSTIPTTIEMPYNGVVRSSIDLYVNRRRQLVENMLGMSLYYMPIFEEALDREGLPLELRNLPVIESALNPDAVSRAGATGLWQFMLQTARGLGMEINELVDERRDPLVSSAMAAKYLKQLYNIYGDWSLAIASYNCGPGNVNKALLRAGASKENKKDFWDIYYNLPSETRGYVPAFIGATYAMTYYADHGISPALAKKPILTDTIHVNQRIYFGPIASTLDIPVEELRVLNPQYRKDIIPGDIKPYALRLPSQMIYTYLMNEDSIVAASSELRARTVVELPDPNAASAGDGTTVTYRDETKYYTVRRGDTASSVAKKLGVSESSLKKWNKLRSGKLKKGAKLKYVKRVAVNVPAPTNVVTPQAAEPAAETPTPTENGAATQQAADGDDEFTRLPDITDADVSGGEAAPESAPAKSKAKAAEQAAPAKSTAKTKEAASTSKSKKEKAKTPATKNHKVKKGETLYKISKQYGVTVEEIQKANGMKNANIKPDQTLKIPKKK
jgi:membrane-bound lytic murein transglycosylase D